MDRNRGTGHHDALVFTLGLDQLTKRTDDETLKKLAAGKSLSGSDTALYTSAVINHYEHGY